MLHVLAPSLKPVNNLICCKTGLMWVVKRASSLFNPFCSNVARQVFYCPLYRTLTHKFCLLKASFKCGFRWQASNLETQKRQNGLTFTNQTHNPCPFELDKVKFFFLRGSLRCLTAALVGFELQLFTFFWKAQVNRLAPPRQVDEWRKKFSKTMTSQYLIWSL